MPSIDDMTVGELRTVRRRLLDAPLWHLPTFVEHLKRVESQLEYKTAIYRPEKPVNTDFARIAREVERRNHDLEERQKGVEYADFVLGSLPTRKARILAYKQHFPDASQAKGAFMGGVYQRVCEKYPYCLKARMVCFERGQRLS